MVWAGTGPSGEHKTTVQRRVGGKEERCGRWRLEEPIEIQVE